MTQTTPQNPQECDKYNTLDNKTEITGMLEEITEVVNNDSEGEQ